MNGDNMNGDGSNYLPTVPEENRTVPIYILSKEKALALNEIEEAISPGLVPEESINDTV